MKKKYELPEEELNNRIDEAESQVEAGDVVAGECVHAQMRAFVRSYTPSTPMAL